MTQKSKSTEKVESVKMTSSQTVEGGENAAGRDINIDNRTILGDMVVFEGAKEWKASYTVPYCPDCNAKNEVSEIGAQVVCQECGKKYFFKLENPNISEFKTVAPAESDKFRGLLFRINMYMETGEYDNAFGLLNELEVIGPRESIVWEYKAIAHYLKTRKLLIIGEHLALIRNYYGAIKRNCATSETIQQHFGWIAYNLSGYLNVLAKRVQDYTDYRARQGLWHLLQTWFGCNEIHQDASFLKRVERIVLENGVFIAKKYNGEWLNIYPDFDAISIYKRVQSILEKQTGKREEPKIKFNSWQDRVLAPFWQLWQAIRSKVGGN